MQKVSESEKEFRHGDSGPKYLFRGPLIDWGILVLKQGQTLGCHLHEKVEETFYFLEGTPEMIVDDQVFRVSPGDAYRVEPGEKHDINNDYSSATKMIFIKTPFIPDDKQDC